MMVIIIDMAIVMNVILRAAEWCMPHPALDSPSLARLLSRCVGWEGLGKGCSLSLSFFLSIPLSPSLSLSFSLSLLSLSVSLPCSLSVTGWLSFYKRHSLDQSSLSHGVSLPVNWLPPSARAAEKHTQLALSESKLKPSRERETERERHRDIERESERNRKSVSERGHTRERERECSVCEAVQLVLPPCCWIFAVWRTRWTTAP